MYDQLTPELKRCVDLSKEKGSSSWLSVLPLEEHGFYLHKGEFRDALCLRYGWKPNKTPQTCNCGAQFTVNHAMICHMGGFPTIRHNEIRDITASLLTEVCNNVATEPPLEPLSEHLIPVLTGRPPCSSMIRDLLALPVRLGGLGIRDPSATSSDKV